MKILKYQQCWPLLFSTKVVLYIFYNFFPDKMMENPWCVDTIDAFYFLKCPECTFDTKDQADFCNHAVENHPLSYVFFGKKSENEKVVKLKCEEITGNDKQLETNLPLELNVTEEMLEISLEEGYSEGHLKSVEIEHKDPLEIINKRKQMYDIRHEHYDPEPEYFSGSPSNSKMIKENVYSDQIQGAN